MHGRQNGGTNAKQRRKFHDTFKSSDAAYGRQSNEVFTRVGGRIIWRGKIALALKGPKALTSDECFIAEYPSLEAFVEMIADPIYREAVKHRQAAREGPRPIRLAPEATRLGFGSSHIELVLFD